MYDNMVRQHAFLFCCTCVVVGSKSFAIASTLVLWYDIKDGVTNSFV